MSAVDTVGNDERQPLLPPTVLVNDQEVHDEENPSNLARNDDDEEPKRKRSWWSIFWYTLLAALGVFYAVLFIKGFIEARDVNVRCFVISQDKAQTTLGWSRPV